MSIPLRYRLLRIALLGCIVVTMGFALVPGASANVKCPIPPGPPFYARIVMHCPVCVQHNDEWAVIPFYHLPERCASRVSTCGSVRRSPAPSE